jgi:hypothetical protein
MFSEQARHASRERDGCTSGQYTGLQKHLKKKRSRTKAPSQFKNRAISSDIEPLKKARNISQNKDKIRDDSRKVVQQESKSFVIPLFKRYINNNFSLGRHSNRQNYDSARNDSQNTNKRPTKKEVSK